jgi:phosphoadenosine phosphosulfate reductase
MTPLEARESNAIAVLKSHEPDEGYWVAFSGGKDSIVVYDLVKKSGVKHTVHFNQTTIDPTEMYPFIRENYPEVIWEKPKRSMFAAIKARQVPPTRMRRYCCAELKELHGIGRIVVTGVRKEESTARDGRVEYGPSHYNKNTFYCNPILNWTEQDVWDYIAENKLPYPSLYNDGYTRIGCIMCPLQNRYGMLKDAVRYPKYYQQYLESFKVMLKNCEERSKNKDTVLQWKSSEDVMFWWIYGIHRDKCNKPHWKLPTEDGFDLEAIKPRAIRRKL